MRLKTHTAPTQYSTRVPNRSVHSVISHNESMMMISIQFVENPVKFERFTLR